MNDQTDLAYFVLALRTAADELDSDVLRVLTKDAGRITREMVQLRALLREYYEGNDWNDGDSCCFCLGDRTGEPGRYQHDPNCLIARIERCVPAAVGDERERR